MAGGGGGVGWRVDGVERRSTYILFLKARFLFSHPTLTYHTLSFFRTHLKISNGNRIKVTFKTWGHYYANKAHFWLLARKNKANCLHCSLLCFDWLKLHHHFIRTKINLRFHESYPEGTCIFVTKIVCKAGRWELLKSHSHITWEWL